MREGELALEHPLDQVVEFRSIRKHSHLDRRPTLVLDLVLLLLQAVPRDPSGLRMVQHVAVGGVLVPEDIVCA